MLRQNCPAYLKQIVIRTGFPKIEGEFLVCVSFEMVVFYFNAA